MPPEITAPAARKITARQDRFIAEKLADPNISNAEAARRAGAKPKTARIVACQWMALPHIKAEIERRKADQLERAGVNGHGVLKELAAIGHSNILDYLPALGLEDSPLKNLTREQGAAVQQIEVEEFDDKPKVEAKPGEPEKVEAEEQKPRRKLTRRVTLKLAPKTPALELLGKHLNLWGAEGDGVTQLIGQQVNVSIRRVGD